MRGLAFYIKKYKYWLLLWLSFPQLCSAQASKISTLELKLKQPLADSARLQTLGQLTDAYSSVDINKKFYYAGLSKTLAEKLHNDTTVANAYLNMGVVCAIKSKSDSALYYFSAAYNQGDKIKFYRVMGKSLSDIGFVYDRLDDKQDAIKNYFQALPLLRKANFLRGINQCLTNIGSIYFDLNQYQLAKSYFDQCLQSSTENHDEADIAYALFNTGSCYQKMGQDTKAMDNLTRSLAMRQKLGDVNGIALVQRSIADVYLDEKKYSLALNNLDTALKTVTRLQDKYEQTAFLLDKADVYTAMGQYDKAKVCALQCVENGKLIKSKLAISEALEKLIAIAKKENDVPNGYKYQSQYIAIQDSIQADKAITDVTLTELSRVRSENASLAKNNELITSKNTSYRQRISQYSDTIIIIAVVLGSVTVLLLILYRGNIEKRATNAQLLKQKEEIAAVNHQLEMLNEELRAQMELTSSQNTELEMVNNIKNKLFSIISHDLRSPIATLQTLFSVYREGDIKKSELKHLLTVMEDSLLSTGTFLDNLLEWSKSQLEGIVVHPVNFDINEAIEENITLFEVKIGLKDLKVSNLSHQPVLVNADRNMINLVVRNLLSNSIKFCNPGDEITFDVQASAEIVTISIADTGPGISEADSEKLFSLEHTVSTGSHGERGNRLGLVLVKDMLEQNNGSIRFETEPGKGTTFWVELPAGKK